MAPRRHPGRRRGRAPGPRGFTLIELAVVLSVIALLLLMVAPRYFGAVQRSEEKVQQHNVHQIRVAIDQYYADRGRYPDSLPELVEQRYLRALPVNPVTQTTDWPTLPPPAGLPGAVYDVQVESAEAADAALGRTQ